MKEENCPCCPNHCDKENLNCWRGREYFGSTNRQDDPKTLEEKVISELRKSGHKLHHQREGNPIEMLSNMTKEELETLHELLSKID